MENKILIALFMGYIQNGDDEYLIHPETNYDHAVEGADWFLYDTSWDWLMPVVEKIETLGYDIAILQNGSILTHEGKELFNNVSQVSYDNKIELTFAAVVFFINHYNKELVKTYTWKCTSETVWTSFDYGNVLANSREEAKALAIKQLKYDVDKVNEVLGSADVTQGFVIEFDIDNLTVTEKV